MRRYLQFIILFLTIPVLCFGGQIEYTTYLPSPAAVYDTIRLVPQAALPSPCNIGEMHMLIDGTLRYCGDDGSGDGVWGPLGSSPWTLNGNNLFPANVSDPNLKVGIGTSEPSELFTMKTPVNTQLEFFEDTNLGNGNIGMHMDSTNQDPGADGDLFFYHENDMRLEFDDSRTYIRNAAANATRIFNDYDQAGEVEVMTILDGLVGIGTSTPQYDLEVAADGILTLQDNNSLLDFNSPTNDDFRLKCCNNGSVRNSMFIQSNTGTGFNSRMTFNQDDDRVGINTETPDFTLDVNGEVNSKGYFLNGSPFNPGNGYWNKNGSNKIYNNNSGQVGINKTKPKAELDMEGGFVIEVNDPEAFVLETDSGIQMIKIDTSFSADKHNQITLRGGNTTTGLWLKDRNDNTIMNFDTKHAKIGFRIGTAEPSHTLQVNGSAQKTGGGNWSTPSDRRFKKDIQPIRGALNDMLRLQGVNFEWIDPAGQGNLTGEQMGMIAQDVEKVFPDWVSTMPDQYKDLTPYGFFPLTVETFKEMNNNMDEKFSEIDRKINELEQLIEQNNKELKTINL